MDVFVSVKNIQNIKTCRGDRRYQLGLGLAAFKILVGDASMHPSFEL